MECLIGQEVSGTSFVAKPISTHILIVGTPYAAACSIVPMILPSWTLAIAIPGSCDEVEA